MDIIKDGGKVCDQEFTPIQERVKHYKEAIRGANEESGQKTLYSANINLALIWYESPSLGMLAHLLIGKLPRLSGADLGIEFVVGAGGAMQGHLDGITTGAQTMLQALEAAACGIPLEKYARGEHVQLRAALEKWK